MFQDSKNSTVGALTSQPTSVVKKPAAIRDTPELERDAEVLEKIIPELYQFAARLLRIGGRGDATASDLVQSAIRSHLSAVRKGRSEPVNSLQALLVTIVKRKAWKQVRRRDKQLDEQAVSAPASHNEPAGAIERMTAGGLSPDSLARLHDLLRLLPSDTHRAIAVLTADGYIQEEIADCLNISIRTVRNRIREIKLHWGSYERD